MHIQLDGIEYRNDLVSRDALPHVHSLYDPRTLPLLNCSLDLWCSQEMELSMQDS